MAIAHIAVLHLHLADAIPLHVIEQSRIMPEHPSGKEWESSIALSTIIQKVELSRLQWDSIDFLGA